MHPSQSEAGRSVVSQQPEVTDELTPLQEPDGVRGANPLLQQQSPTVDRESPGVVEEETEQETGEASSAPPSGNLFKE